MKHVPDVWTLKGDQIREPVQYLGCGLDNIWLASGYNVETVDGETSIAVRDLEGLHQAIGRYLAKRKKLLTGKEIRFLRQQMDLTQSELARLVGCDAQQIARYEKEQNKMPGPADRVLRMLYRDHLGNHCSARDILEALDGLDGRMDDRQIFSVTADGWKSAA